MLDSVTRHVVVAGIVRALHDQIASAVTDTISRPWVLFAFDSTRTWSAERAGVGRLLRARTPRSEDRHAAALIVSAVDLLKDSVRARFSIVYYERCDARWTARGTDYRWVAPRNATNRVDGPVSARLWDGISCDELARHPNVLGGDGPPRADTTSDSRGRPPRL